MPPQSSGNALQTNLRPDSKDPSNGDAAASGELQDPSHSSTRPAEAADARAKLRDKNKRAQKRFRERKKASLPGLKTFLRMITLAVTESCHKACINAHLASKAMINALFSELTLRSQFLLEVATPPFNQKNQEIKRCGCQKSL